MAISLNAVVAGEERAARPHPGAHRQPATPSGVTKSEIVALRPATVADAVALKTLAELDEEPELSGEVLVASIDGAAVAAMSLLDGRIVSNPFVATSDAVSLLTLRARQIAGVSARQARRRWPPRLA